MCARLFMGMLTLVLCTCSCTMANFAEVPSSIVTALGTATPPHYRCRHTSSNALINWLVNNTSSGLFPDIISGSIDEDGIIVHTLTIPAELQYNGTVVECVALFLDGSPTDRTPAATYKLVFIPTDSLPDTAGFEISPSPLTVAVEQGTATFQCQCSDADLIDWRVNGTSLNTAVNLSNISGTSTRPSNGVILYMLSIETLLAYDGTIIECVAAFHDRSFQFTPPVTLRIQDTPKQVENVTLLRDYSEDELTILWNLLPTLDINDTDPDILYTIELYQITCGQEILINRTEVAGSNVTEEGLDLMQIYKAVIAARNNVREARNGPNAEMKERFMSLNGPTLLGLTRNSQINIQNDTLVPSYYEMTLESLDGCEDLATNITVERNGEVIIMHLEESVPPNSLWRASILAYGCESDGVVTDYELSTHDIQNVVASSQLPGQITVIGELISEATATGVLVVVYSLTNSEDMHYIAKQTEGDRISLNVSGLTGAEYGVSTFALENGLPLPSVVASPTNITILNAHQDRAPQQPPLTEYELISNSSHVCITCAFPIDSSTTGCVAVVHQRISQLSSSGLMNIESSHKFTRSGDTAYGCIEGVNLEQYQVGVVGGKMTMEPKSRNKESSLAGAITGVLGGIVVAVIVTVAVIVAVVACTRLKRRRKTAAQPGYSQVTPPSGSQTHTIANIESGSRAAVENHYAESAGLSVSPAEEQPLLPPPPLPARVEDDGGSSPGVSTPHVSGSANHGTHTSLTADNGADDPTTEEDPPPLPPRLMDDSAPLPELANQDTSASPHQVTSEDGAGDPTYATILAMTPNTADYHTHTTPTADNSAGDPTERPAPPPLPPRLVDDGASTPPVSESADQSTPHQITSDNGAGDSTYTSVLTTTPHTVSQPAATEKVSYEDIQKYQNQQGQHYALPQLKVTSNSGAVDDLHQVVYSEIKPGSITQTGDQNIDCTSDRAVAPPPVPSREPATVAGGEPLTIEQLFSFLLPHASKWQALGLALSLDDDQLDEIYTNNETNEACLQEMLELYMTRSDLDHSWEEVQAAVEKIESSDGVPISVQEVSSSQNSPVISGKTICVPDMDAGDAHVHKHPVANMDDCHSSDHETNSESGYTGSQPSETGSIDSFALSQTELAEASEKTVPLSGDLEVLEYESALIHPSGREATCTLTDGSNSEDRTTEEELPMLHTSTPGPFKFCSPDLQVGGFCEKPEDQSNDDELCKMSQWLYQNSHAHSNYNEALMRQMGLQIYQKVRDKVDNNNVVEESALVHGDHECLHQYLLKLSDKE